MNDATSLIMAQWKAYREKAFHENKVFLKRLARSLPPIGTLRQVHDSVFEQFDCLACAQCCTSSSPVFTRTDIQRIASHLGVKPGMLEQQHLEADSEGDWIPKSRPCPFLQSDNRCKVYEVRPKSCRGYPHTDEKEGWERHDLLARNTRACPAAFQMVEKLKSKK
jgi:Fe-S-cluster containining protein